MVWSGVKVNEYTMSVHRKLHNLQQNVKSEKLITFPYTIVMYSSTDYKATFLYMHCRFALRIQKNWWPDYLNYNNIQCL